MGRPQLDQGRAAGSTRPRATSHPACCEQRHADRAACDEVEAQCQRAEAAAHDFAVRRPAVEPFLR